MRSVLPPWPSLASARTEQRRTAPLPASPTSALRTTWSSSKAPSTRAAHLPVTSITTTSISPKAPASPLPEHPQQPQTTTSAPTPAAQNTVQTTFVTQPPLTLNTPSTSSTSATPSPPTVSTSASEQSTTATGSSTSSTISSAPASLSSGSVPPPASSTTISSTQDDSTGGPAHGLSSTIVTPLFAALGTLLLITLLAAVFLYVRRRRGGRPERGALLEASGGASVTDSSSGYGERKSEDYHSEVLRAGSPTPRDEPLLPNRPYTDPPASSLRVSSADTDGMLPPAPEGDANGEKVDYADPPWLYASAPTSLPHIPHRETLGDDEFHPQGPGLELDAEPAQTAPRITTLLPPPRLSVMPPDGGILPSSPPDSGEPRFVAVLMDLRASASVDQPPPYQPRPRDVRLETAPGEREVRDGYF
ncbi:hypothetical protein OH77DRAFT_1031328 [Trametes cingulata]|nr:hypothetical protein OH77DRAFT_1031328 [Trametes cingulata]